MTDDDNRSDAEETSTEEVVLADKYGDMSEHGAGWGCKVYTAREPDTGRAVLINVGPAPGRMDRAQREAELRREVTVLSRLQHRHVPSLLDTGVSHDGRFFYVVEHLEAEPLSRLLTGEHLEPVLAYEIMGQALDALAAMHEAGVVHRDVCPDTVLLVEGESEEVWVVLDTRRARVLEGEAGQSESALERLGATMGKRPYAAPEQLRGGGASPASDLYSWGITLLECLTGANPYARYSDAEALSRQGSSDPVPIPAALQHDPVGELLERALVKDAARREVEAKPLHDEVMGLLRQELELRLGSADTEVRVAALRKLADLGLRGALYNIIECLEDPEPEVRFHALRALDRLKALSAIATIKPLLEDPDELVQKRARIAWRNLLPNNAGDGDLPRDADDLPGADVDDVYERREEQTVAARVSRHTDVSFPRSVNGEEQRISLVVRLTVDRPRYSVSTETLSMPAQSVVDICLEAPDFKVLNEASQQTRVSERGDSAPVVFDLRPLAAKKGEAEIRLEFVQAGQTLGTAAARVEIASDEPTAEAEHTEGPHIG